MEMKLEVPDFTESKGIQCKWETGFEIDVKYENGVVTIAANKEGLISMANHLLNLAQAKVPSGRHLHFDEYNSLEETSIELIILKK